MMNGYGPSGMMGGPGYSGPGSGAYGPGMMGGYGGMMGGGFGYGPGGMMGTNGPNNGAAPPEVSADMPVSPEQATETAQAYLDLALPGVVAT